MIGQTISHYKILEKLGEGGMGVVYKAQDLKLDRPVALKFLPPDLASSQEETARFQQEARAISSLNHPNIATIHDVDEADGKRFIVLEFLPGGSLKSKNKEIYSSGHELSLAQVVEYGLQIAEGLAHAHRLGIIHRDVKTENMMLTGEGKVKITDFGLAKLRGGAHVTKTGSTVGTAAYMSPEQIRGEEVDQRTDLFSFGVLLYELATGHLPFRGEHEAALSYSIVNEDPVSLKSLRPSLPSALENIIDRCLEKNREKRFQRGEELVAELRNVQQEFSRPVSAAAKASKLPWIVTAAVVILAVIALYVYFPSKPSPTNGKSIAVLPFADLSPQKDQEYFCDGMTEEIIGKLSKLRELKVISRTSVMRYKHTNKDIKEIGKELAVATILEGSIRKEKDNIRITAQLINVEDGFHLWSQTYDRTLESVFAIQDDVSKAIAQALKIEFTETEATQLGKVPTRNVQAYELYLKGRSLFYTYERSKTEEASEMFKQALDLDSSFALAYAGLSLCYTQYHNSGWDSDEKWLVLAESAANKAIALDSNSAEAHFALGFVYEQRPAYDEMEREMRKVLELNPNHAHAHDSMGDVLYRAKGQLEEALHEYSAALSTDPFLIPSYWGIADVKLKQGKYRSSNEILLRSLEFHQNDDIGMTNLGQVYRLQGKYESAVEVFKRAIELNPSRIRAHFQLGLTYASQRRYAEARTEAEIIAGIVKTPKEQNLSFLYLLGWIFLEQGNWEAALENFKQALRMKETQRWISPQDLRSALAETYLRQGNFTDAIEEYSNLDDSPIGSFRVENMWATRHYKLGVAHEKLDDPARAKQEYEIFLDLWKDADKDLPELIDAKARLANLRGVATR